jgi:proteasome lid subunit RPN8/RPN11
MMLGLSSSILKAFISDSLLNEITSLARFNHPKEIILLLRGRVEENQIFIDDYLIPPLAVSGFSFAEFPTRMLPIDFSVIGTAHSHPTGFQNPSVRDLNNFYNRIMMIMPYPYTADKVGVFNSKGENIPLDLQ